MSSTTRKADDGGVTRPSELSPGAPAVLTQWLQVCGSQAGERARATQESASKDLKLPMVSQTGEPPAHK